MKGVEFGSPEQGLRATWRLGPGVDPGWFETGQPSTPGKFALATVFRLHWQSPSMPQDGIYHMVHAVTMGRASRPGKTHLEQMVQILHGDLHITCRMDICGVVSRNTVPLPGTWNLYNDRTMLLIYTADIDSENPEILNATHVLYDFHSLEQLQCVDHMTQTPSTTYMDFTSWPDYRVTCDHEQDHVPSNHLFVHGHCCENFPVDLSFELFRLWGSLGQTFDAQNMENVRKLVTDRVPDRIDSAEAWYNIDCARSWQEGQDFFSECSGLYRKSTLDQFS